MKNKKKDDDIAERLETEEGYGDYNNNGYNRLG
jgi:hypothetical protein